LPNEYEFLDNHHPDDFDSIIVCNGCYPSAPFHLSISQENFVSKYLDLEFDSTKEDFLI